MALQIVVSFLIGDGANALSSQIADTTLALACVAAMLTAPAPQAPGPGSQARGEAEFPKRRVPEEMVLQRNQPSQPSSEPRHSFPAAPAQPPRPPPEGAAPPPTPTPAPLPRVIPAPAAPGAGIVSLATWYGGADGYGPDDLMADGSYFDPNDPTIAAANRWPLGSWLKVCLDSRCIEVQVRDRGPFGHALDLSYAAFSRLAPPRAGVITVTISRVR